MRSAAASIVKHGNSPDENEDAFSSGVLRGGRARFAVADGATEGMLSREWAEILAASFQRYGTGSAKELFENAALDFDDWRREYLKQRERNGKPLAWYEEPGFEKGAFATLLGIELRPNEWEALAIGDCTLMQVRDGKLLIAWPLERPEEFGSSPDLARSRMDRLAATLGASSTKAGTWRPGDSFVLMTDALAAWILKRLGTGEPTIEDVVRFVTASASERTRLVTEWRDAGMRNDDVTAILVET